MFDVLIKNGTIIDGTGEPMYKADVGIKEEKIVKIGQLQNEKAEVEIDATNLLVCPGFVDINNHSDTYWQIFLNPDLESLIYQGVTTIVGGNCGSSLAPLFGKESIQSIQKWVNLGRISFNWIKLEEFFNFIKNKEISVNFGTLVGHNTLRRGVVKNSVEDLTAKEKTTMEIVLADSIKKGALGISAGLVYVHSRSASTEELVSLAKIVKNKKGIFVLHLRDEGAKLVESIKEVVEVAQESGAKIHISHLKAMGNKNWPLMDEVINILEKAKNNKADITFDVYPYTATGTVLHTLLPVWVTEGGKQMMLRRLKDKDLRSKIIRDMKKTGIDYSKIKIAISPVVKSLAKRGITEIAASQEKTVEDTLLDVLIASEGHLIVSMEILSEENIEKIITNPSAIVSSNGAGYNLEYAKSGEVVHPRNFGTFPRVLFKYALQKQIISWEEAIKKMTSFPAERFGLSKRGKIKEKYFADIVIINRDKVKDLATNENPYQYCQGIEFVLVNGKPVLENGRYLGVKNGMILKKD